jgi:hypothetical protein
MDMRDVFDFFMFMQMKQSNGFCANSRKRIKDLQMNGFQCSEQGA